LTFPCSSTPYHMGSLSTEPNGALVFAMASGCTNAKVYIHGTLTFKGTMSSGGNPAFTSTINVLFVVTSSNMVDIQSNFNGVLMAPNAYIHAVPGKHHYGAFYGSTVYLEQDTEFEHRPFNAPLPLQ